jgi:hypothetical protein
MKKINYVIPLGSNCYVASYLKRNNIKLTSYPFDWIFSYPNDIIDMLETNFEKILDKNCYLYKDDTIDYNFHNIYCPTLRMFNHYNPYKESDYKYVERCINRLNNVLEKKENKLFIMMFVNNNVNNEIKNIIKLAKIISKKTSNYDIICFFQNKRGYQDRKIINFMNIKLIQLSTIDGNNGVNFILDKDEEYFNKIINEFYKIELINDIK